MSCSWFVYEILTVVREIMPFALIYNKLKHSHAKHLNPYNNNVLW